MNNEMLYLAGLVENFQDSPNVQDQRYPEMCGWYFSMIKMAYEQLSRAVRLAEDKDDPADVEWLLKEVKEVVKRLEESHARAREREYIK